MCFGDTFPEVGVRMIHRLQSLLKLGNLLFCLELSVPNMLIKPLPQLVSSHTNLHVWVVKELREVGQNRVNLVEIVGFLALRALSKSYGILVFFDAVIVFRELGADCERLDGIVGEKLTFHALEILLLFLGD